MLTHAVNVTPLATLVVEETPAAAETATAAANSFRKALAAETTKKAANLPLRQVLKMLASETLPKVDNDGLMYFTADRGRKAVNEKDIREGTALTNLLNERFAQRPVISLEHPRNRALKHKQSAFWTKAEMQKAMEEFTIPQNQRIILIFPELFDRSLLALHEEYQTDVKGGVLTPCHKCRKNTYVKQKGFCLYDNATRCTLREDMMHDVVFSPQYECENVDDECAKKKKKTTVRNGKEYEETVIQGTKFRAYTGPTWDNYPEALKARYEQYISRIDDGGSSFLSPEMCAKILYEGSNFSEMAANLEGAYNRLLTMCQKAYGEFINEEVAKEKCQRKRKLTGQIPFKPLRAPVPAERNDTDSADKCKWPEFDESLIDPCHKPISDQTVQAVFWKVYTSVEPYLLRDLLSRTPGKIIRWDGTFAVMKRTMDDLEVEEENEVCVKIFGEYGHILSWAFARSEGDIVLQRLLFFLRKRIERIGGIKKLMETLAAYSDTCCQGLDDPTQHWVTKIFIAMTRGPLKDIFHGITRLLDGFDGIGHELHFAFHERVWSTMLLWEEESKQQNLAIYMKNEGKGMARAVALDNMKKSKRYKDRMYNYTNPNVTAAESEIKKAFQEIVAADKQLAQEAKAEENTMPRGKKRKRYRHYVKQAVEGVHRGSAAYVDEFCGHVHKGCYVDPLSPREMSYPASGKEPADENPRPQKRRRGTNNIENDNKHSMKTVVGSATRQKPELSHAKMLIHAHALNNRIDASIEHVTGIKAKSLDWPVREAVRKAAEGHVDGNMFPGEVYPPEIDLAEVMEPIGMLYGRYAEWETRDAELKALLQADAEEQQEIQAATTTAAIRVAGEDGLGCMAEHVGALVDNSDDASSHFLGDDNSNHNDTLGDDSDNQKMPSVDGAADALPRDDHFSKSTWARRLGGNNCLTVDSYFNGNLAPFHHEQLMDCYRTIYNVHGDSIPAGELSIKIAEIYNSRHLEQAKGDNYGFGGKVRVNLVKNWLRTAGVKMLAGNVGALSAPQVIYSAPVIPQAMHQAPRIMIDYQHRANPAIPRVYSREEIDNMSHREAQNLCIVLRVTGLKYPKKTLLKHFKYEK